MAEQGNARVPDPGRDGRFSGACPAPAGRTLAGRAWLLVCTAAIVLSTVPTALAQKLAVVNTELAQYEDGPPVGGGFDFYPGDTVFFRFEIAGYQLGNEDAIDLGYEIEALDPEGLRLKEPVHGEIKTTLTPQDKKRQWKPVVRYSVLVPPAAPSGDYRLAVQVEDRLKHATATAEVKFRVRGQDVEPSDTLVVRNFRFFRSETSVKPLSAPVYHPGESLWARFQITGYKFGANNRFSIAYGIRVLKADGAVLYEQPVAASEQRESYYPERHIAGALSLKLQPTLAKGEYTLAVTVRDKIGNQTCEAKQIFKVE